ncbi:TonB family protein [Ignavibacterium sp.]|uniref:TonB family protein n=1 Tax=Ignavibacterium sp. TaxID=2651167 RepID=UPI00307E213F
MVATKNQITDGELVLKIAGFNAQAFEQLYSRYSSFLYSLVKKIVGDPKLSERVLLNVFTLFWKRIEFYDATTNNVYTHLTLLTRNRAIDVLKRMDEHKLSPAYDDLYEFEKIIPKLSPVIKPISLELALAFGERVRFYKTQLTEVQNLILNMIFFEGLTDEEIAKKLNVPEATIKQKVQTVLGTMMQNLSGKNLETGGNKKVIDLIKLEAIGRLSKDEKGYLTNQKLEDPEFPYAILGEYQNLVALLASTVVQENPPTDLSKEITRLFSNVLIGNTDEYNVIIPNKFTKPEVTINNNPPKQDTSTSQEDFPIRFKEPSKQDLEIIEEISQIVPEQEKVEEKPVEKIPEPALIENKFVSPAPVENKSPDIKPATKPEPNENKAPIEIQNKVQSSPSVEQPKLVKEVKPKQPDPVSINKTINQILSKTETVQEKSKPADDKKSTSSEPQIKPEVKQERTIVDKIPEVVENKSPVKQEDKNVVKELKRDSEIKETKHVVSKEEKSRQIISDKIKDEKTPNKVHQPEFKPIVKDETKDDKKFAAQTTDEDHNIEKLIEDYKQSYKKEIGELQKKLRRNIMITVGLILLLFGGGFAIYLSMQKEQAKLVTKVEQSTSTQNNEINSQQVVEQPLNQASQQNENNLPVTKPEEIKNEPQKTEPQKVESVTKEVQKVVYPPLPEGPKIQEPVLNGESKSQTSNDQNNTQANQPKTEKPKEEVIPPREEKPVTEEPSFFVAVEEPPQPKGGLAAIQNKIVYPIAAKRLGIEGKVLIQAIIDENGNVAKAKVIKGIGYGCDEAALDAVKGSKFTPGKQRGKNVRVQITIPIVFKL